MKLGELDFKLQFFWKGDRYNQFLRPKPELMKKAFKVTCYKSSNPYRLVDMPSGRNVKPVLKWQKQKSP